VNTDSKKPRTRPTAALTRQRITPKKTTMQYMILIYGNEGGWDAMSEAQRAESFAAFMQYNKDLAASGKLRLAEQLQPSKTARKVHVDQGKLVTTDGPYAETKEQLGGFYIVDVADEAEAMALAQKCPAVWGGVLEVRPLVPLPDPASRRG